ncbi:hypothetical protein GGR51DRAFT_567646 [Nemania sp. FL0031]|nr:hypothetical protein GGR51DRAFT_567646 [Nemania sp. FL0031]
MENLSTECPSSPSTSIPIPAAPASLNIAVHFDSPSLSNIDSIDEGNSISETINFRGRNVSVSNLSVISRQSLEHLGFSIRGYIRQVRGVARKILSKGWEWLRWATIIFLTMPCMMFAVFGIAADLINEKLHEMYGSEQPHDEDEYSGRARHRDTDISRDASDTSDSDDTIIASDANDTHRYLIPMDIFKWMDQEASNFYLGPWRLDLPFLAKSWL